MGTFNHAIFTGLFMCVMPVTAQEIDHRYLQPESVAPALGQYSLGVETTGDVRWVHVAGQTGIALDGTIAKDFESQARLVMDNIRAILAEGGMGWEDVVSYRVYMTHREDLGVWRSINREILAGAKPAGTLLFVNGLIDPDLRIEIEVTAAKEISE